MGQGQSPFFFLNFVLKFFFHCACNEHGPRPPNPVVFLKMTPIIDIFVFQFCFKKKRIINFFFDFHFEIFFFSLTKNFFYIFLFWIFFFDFVFWFIFLISFWIFFLNDPHSGYRWPDDITRWQAKWTGVSIDGLGAGYFLPTDWELRPEFRLMGLANAWGI